MFTRPLALRARLALTYSAFFGLVLLLLGLGIFLLARYLLFTEIANQLEASTELIQQDFAEQNADLQSYFGDPAFLMRTHPPHLEELDVPTLFVQASQLDGTVAARSPSLQARTLPLETAQRATVEMGRPVVGEGQLGGLPVYMRSTPLLAGTTIVGVLQVAQPLREAERMLALLLGGLLVIGTLGFLAALRAAFWLTSGALQPVGEIARTANQIIRAEDLAQRVPVVPTEDEIGHLTRTINDMLARLEILFRAQQRFVADVSHELRTPLAAMRGNLEMLRRGAASDPDAVDESLADIEREAARLARLTNDLLTLAQADSGVHIRHEPVALDEVVLEICRDLRKLAGPVALVPAFETQLEVPGDRDRIVQALINLVANAIQHTPPGGRVTLGLAQDASHALLYVRDTGVGIPPEALPHVFERFYRADGSRTAVSGGAGLGLAIVLWIAEAHGGWVRAESTPGQGSTFTLALPLHGQEP